MCVNLTLATHVDSDVVLFLNFVVLSLRYRKFNVCIIQPFNELFVDSLNPLRIRLFAGLDV